MNLKEVIKLITETDKRPRYTFERIAIILLEKHFDEAGGLLLTSYRPPNANIEFDGVVLLQDAFVNDPLIVIEIIFSRTSIFLKKKLESIVDISKPFHNSQSKFLIISPLELKKAEKEKIITSLKKKSPNLNIEIWDLNSLSPIFNKYAEFVSDFIPQIGQKAIKNIVTKSLEFKDWKKEREKLLEKLRTAHSNDDLVLFLGAGISASAGLPDWNSLLSELLVTMISKNLPADKDVNNDEKTIIARSLQKLNISSPLLEARYVNSGLGDNFDKEVAKVLYKDVKVNTSSDLIKAIANLCIPPRGALGIRAIVTYNFDDLIESELHKLSLKYRSIYRDVDIPTKEELGVFHVHGFLPREGNSYDGISESLLVFSEKNYHTIMQDPYFWSNLIQLNFYRENTCVLIGLSGTDPNLRRLLEIAKRKTKFAKHYILLKRTENKFFEDEYTKANKEFKDELIEAINSIHHNLQERSFDELGLSIVWYEDYTEIPKILDLINSRKEK